MKIMTEKEKQTIIVRQSQLKMALEFANNCGWCLSGLELVTLAEVLTSYCMEGTEKSVLDRVRQMDTHFTQKSNAK